VMCSPSCGDPTHVCVDLDLRLVRVSVRLGSYVPLFLSFPDKRISRAERRRVKGGVGARFGRMGGGRSPLSGACGGGGWEIFHHAMETAVGRHTVVKVTWPAVLYFQVG